MAYLGAFELGTSVFAQVLTTNNGTPSDSDAAPTYRIYSPEGLMNNGTGTCTTFDSGTITAVSRSSNVVTVTSVNHKLTVGTRVYIDAIAGISLSAGYFIVASVVDADNFTIASSGSNGSATGLSVGWHVAGLYKITHLISGADGYESGKSYAVIVNTTIGGTAISDQDDFTVV